MTMTNEELFNFINVYDFVYTKSDRGEDVGFVTKKTKNALVVTFSNMCKRVTFYLNKDKKLRLVQEVWKPIGRTAYRKVWSRDESN